MPVGLMVIMVVLYAVLVAVLFCLAVFWSHERKDEDPSDARLQQIRSEMRVELGKEIEPRLRRAREDSWSEAEVEWERRAMRLRDELQGEWEKRLQLAREEVRVETERQRGRQIEEALAEERARAALDWRSRVQHLRDEIREDVKREWEERARRIRAGADLEARQRLQHASNGSDGRIDRVARDGHPPAGAARGDAGALPPGPVPPASFIEELSKRLHGGSADAPPHREGESPREAP